MALVVSNNEVYESARKLQSDVSDRKQVVVTRHATHFFLCTISGD